MAKLGEAYVRVRADLEPFGKDLDRGLKVITDKFEKALNRSVGKALGKDMGSGVRDGLRESTSGLGAEIGGGLNIPANNRRRGRRAGEDFGNGYGEGIFGTIKKFIGLSVTALEDGFSSLPPQAKAGIGALLIGALIPAGAFLSAAIGTAIIAGVAGIGIALSSQYQEVEDGFKTFTERLRERAVESAEPFAGQTLAALDLFDRKLDELDPKIDSLFQNASRYVEPFARGIAGAVDGLVTGLDEGLDASEFTQLSAAIEEGLTGIGEQLGATFATLLENPDLDVALSDLLQTIEDLIYIGGEFLNWTVSIYSDLRDIAGVVGAVVEGFGNLIDFIGTLTSAPGGTWAEDVAASWDNLVAGVGGGGDTVTKSIMRIDQAGREWNDTTETTIKATEAQEKALKELNQQLVEQERLLNDVISDQIDYQKAIDQTTADLKENGKTLDIRNAKGQENAENIHREIQALRDQVKSQLESGELTEEQAEAFYQKEIARIRARFKGNQEALKQFDELFAKLLKLQTAPQVPNKMSPFTNGIQTSITALEEAQRRLDALSRSAPPTSSNPGSSSSHGPQAYADGGFITEPTNAIMGENYKDEVVLPLTNTRRSMQLLSQSPLAGMLGGGTSVAVYIGNEQLESRMFTVASTVNRQAARTLNQVPRNI